MYLYADDAKLFSNNEAELQGNLDSIVSFTKDRQLSLASAQCQHLAIKRRNNCSTANEYFIDSNHVSSSLAVNDLGILVAGDLKWSMQYAYIANCIYCFHLFISHIEIFCWQKYLDFALMYVLSQSITRLFGLLNTNVILEQLNQCKRLHKKSMYSM